MNDKEILAFIFSNQLLFSTAAGMMGGIVNALELGQNRRVTNVISKVIVGFCAGFLTFFLTYEVHGITSQYRIVASTVAGFGGSALFRKCAKKYLGDDAAQECSSEPQVKVRRRKVK